MIEYAGKTIKFKIEGSSHSKKITLTIDMPFDFEEISEERIKQDLLLRNPKLFFNTQRNEKDEYEIIDYFKNHMVVEFKNNSVDKASYIEHEGFLRPSHSDYAQYLKTKTIESGGGEFSGRMTLPFVFVGSICRQILFNKYNTKIYSRIKQIYNLTDKTTDDEFLQNVSNINDEIRKFATLNEEFKKESFDLLEKIKNSKDSVGGVVETFVLDYEKGVGNSAHRGIESKLSEIIYGIPAVKGVSFGLGFDYVSKYGSEVQDSFSIDHDKIYTSSNYNGGINGGVSNGMPIIINTIIKPTPTIGKETQSLNIYTKKMEKAKYGGNHDCFIANRAVVAIESAIAVVLLDMLYDKE